MPVSRKRKKKGKVVGNGGAKQRKAHAARLLEEEVQHGAGVSLQQLINTLAVQEFQQDPDAYRENHPVLSDTEETEDGR